MKKLILIIALLISSMAFAQSFRPPQNGNVNIPAAGATDRTQMPELEVYSCTFLSPTTNAGAIYIGGHTVTNAAGTNRGIKLAVGQSLSNISVTNLNQIFVAADAANDDVSWICN